MPRRPKLLILGIPLLAALTGCPQSDNLEGTDGVFARIGVSATQGPAPLDVVFSSADSTSQNGEITAYNWDFDGLGNSAEASPSFRFTQPGRYTVTLTVRDETGVEDSAAVIIQVQGDGSVEAIILADVESGLAPLGVNFDGTTSTAEGDEILDYYWDFDDGATSRSATPFHRFAVAGNYDVTLRVVTAGGLEAQTSIQITVGEARGSLQFTGGQLATLPSEAGAALSAFTFEAWIKADAAGGTFALFGTPPVTVSIDPTGNSVSAEIPGVTIRETVFDVASRWRHIAVTYSSTAGASIYLDGVFVRSGPFIGEFDVGDVVIGSQFRGKIARVRFWSQLRSAADIRASASSDLTGNEAGLLGDWPLDDGGGQILRNNGPGDSGLLGRTASVEALDPAWSSDGPDVP